MNTSKVNTDYAAREKAAKLQQQKWFDGHRLTTEISLIDAYGRLGSILWNSNSSEVE